MKIFLLTLLLVLVTAPAFASGDKLSAISSGRTYDRILTPQLNPSYLLDHVGFHRLKLDVEYGRVDINSLPPSVVRRLKKSGLVNR